MKDSTIKIQIRFCILPEEEILVKEAWVIKVFLSNQLRGVVTSLAHTSNGWNPHWKEDKTLHPF